MATTKPSTKKNSDTSVATVTTTGLVIPKNSAEVSTTIEQLKKKLTELKGNRGDSISLDIEYTGSNGNINIKNIKTVGLLLEISSAIHTRNEAYKAEIVRYDLTDRNIAPFKVSEKTVTDWEKIIDKAINELINKTQIQKIESAIEKLSKHISEEEKLANDLKSIAESVTEYIV